jgi:hypothetical protein
MTREQMAEWLAENVLKFNMEMSASSDNLRHYHGGNGIIKEFRMDHLEDFIYSPDGFFAVWDVVEALPVNLTYEHDFFVDRVNDDKVIAHRKFDIRIWNVKEDSCKRGVTIIKTGVLQSRYDSFYKAVKEAWS